MWKGFLFSEPLSASPPKKEDLKSRRRHALKAHFYIAHQPGRTHLIANNGKCNTSFVYADNFPGYVPQFWDFTEGGGGGKELRIKVQ